MALGDGWRIALAAMDIISMEALFDFVGKELKPAFCVMNISECILFCSETKRCNFQDGECCDKRNIPSHSEVFQFCIEEDEFFAGWRNTTDVYARVGVLVLDKLACLLKLCNSPRNCGVGTFNVVYSH